MQNTAIVLTLKIVGFFLILVGVGVLIHFGPAHFQFEFGSKSERLQILWEQDLEKLKAANLLPEAWSDIREIELNPTTDNAKLWMKNVQVPILLKSNGQHRLEILGVSWEEGHSSGLILQYNLVDLKTNNMIWELGRTFTLEGETEENKDRPHALPVEPSSSKGF